MLPKSISISLFLSPGIPLDGLRYYENIGRRFTERWCVEVGGRLVVHLHTASRSGTSIMELRVSEGVLIPGITTLKLFNQFEKLPPASANENQ